MLTDGRGLIQNFCKIVLILHRSCFPIDHVSSALIGLYIIKKGVFAFEHAQNALFQIILHMRKVHPGPLLSIYTSCSIC